MSDDGRFSVVVIALLGNPFSPNYARARQRGAADALEFCSMHVALYAGLKSVWTLVERPIAIRDRSATDVKIGGSRIGWEGDRLTVEIEEKTTPLGRPLRGRIVLHPQALTGLGIDIDESGLHRWWPVAPLARIEVDLPSPGLRFSGHGYHDANAGEVPLESSFESWEWSRSRGKRGALLTYDVACSSGAQLSHAFKVSLAGDVETLGPLKRVALPKTVWQLPRSTQSDAHIDLPPRVLRSLEDGPFYERSLVATHLGGQPVVAMHETLAAYRLRLRWVRLLAAVRMARAR